MEIFITFRGAFILVRRDWDTGCFTALASPYVFFLKSTTYILFTIDCENLFVMLFSMKDNTSISEIKS